MRRRGTRAIKVISGLALALALTGCMSMPVSNTPESRFYILDAAHGARVRKNTITGSEVMVGVGPVRVPEYQMRPQMVTRGREKTVEFAQFDRWGESLDRGVARIIEEDLTAILPGTNFTLYPWNSYIPVKYQVRVEIVRLDCELYGDLVLTAEWEIIDVENSKTLMINKSEFTGPIIPQNYSGLAATLSTASASLSREIADALSTIETHPRTPSPDKP
ncbi:MAG: membrane integrity-associated transporter subunit PqiC [Candidatus Omnitrophica bacterium]|nr:membrane integrity-associated transporter subunit PqiC [Candidatus Omnitrophota bacterium]